MSYYLSIEFDEWLVWKDLLDSSELDGGESDPALGIRADWWNRLWVPLTSDGSGNHYCIDLAPGQGGLVGQVIAMWHDHSARALLAPSFGVWLENFANALEEGRVDYS